MLKIHPLCLIFFIGYIGVNLGFKCEFPTHEKFLPTNPHFCKIIPDTSNVVQDYSPENVTMIEYNGVEQGSVDFTSSNFPICDKFPNLLRINIDTVKRVDENVFKNCKKVEFIRIGNTDMDEISESFFSENLELYHINLIKSKFSTLPENIFSHLKKLQIVNLDHNQITTLPLNIFKPISKLERLHLSYNKIDTLHHEWFDGKDILRELTIERNGLTDLPKNIFSSLISLESLYLSKNNLTVLHADSFGVHRKLDDVDLNDNQITSIDERLFDVTPLEYAIMINLKDNVCLDEALFSKGVSLRNKLGKCFENYRPRE